LENIFSQRSKAKKIWLQGETFFFFITVIKFS